MTVEIKIGRILPKNWIAQQFRKTGGFFTFQSNMWEMWKSAFRTFKQEADKDLKSCKDTLSVNIKTDTERYTDKFIQWQILECYSPEANREDLVIERFRTINDKLNKNYEDLKKKGGIEIKKPQTLKEKTINTLKYSKYEIEEIIKKGLEKEGKSTIVNKMLELDILIDVQKTN